MLTLLEMVGVGQNPDIKSGYPLKHDVDIPTRWYWVKGYIGAVRFDPKGSSMKRKGLTAGLWFWTRIFCPSLRIILHEGGLCI
jgi:hypothetical protein